MTPTTTARKRAAPAKPAPASAGWTDRTLRDVLLRNARLEKRVAALEAHLGLTAKPAGRAKAAR